MSAPQWCFGDFRLDPTNACLWRGAATVPLPPKAFDVLHYLVTHPDRLVTKDELLDVVWAQTAVGEAVVRVAIGAIRRGLRETTQTPRYVATVPRRGYRFLAPVVASRHGAPDPAASPPPPEALTTTPAVASRAPVVRLPDALPPPEAERRRLTVLCCDLVDAPLLAGHLDPEAFRDVVRAFHQACADVIRRFEGSLVHYRGEGVLVYFGYPVAHEDDAQRAVWTGLGLLAALAPLNGRLALPPGEQVAVRLGLHTGLVVVGAVGEGTRQAPLALGEAPHIAAQLLALAAPNTLLLSAETYHLIEGYFTCEAVGTPTLHGLTMPLQVHRVLGPSGVQSRLEVARARGLTPLVGRASERAILRERWARAKAGRGQVVVLAGEAGIGKSRLVQVLKDHVAREPHLCWECRGVSYDQQTALAPIAACLQRWLQWQPGADAAAALMHLEALLTQAQLALEEAVPLLADLVALPLPAERYPLLSSPPAQQRQRTFEVVLALLGTLAEQQPVLLIVEDLHWLDPSTLAWLTLLLDQVPARRLYLVLTCRTEFQAPWGFRTYLTSLMLPRLTTPHVTAMVRGMLGAHHLPAAVLAQIVAQTDGIPLFVEEVTKAVVEGARGTTRPDQDGRSASGPAVGIPATLYEALMARLDRLGSAKDVAQLGATLGREFPYALLRAVAPLEDAALQRDLATLVAAELLSQRGQPPRALYTFTHVLIQEAAYASILQRVRRQTHQRLVEVLEAQLPETTVTHPTLLAYHALRGERWDTAAAAWRQVGEQALARSAYREAVAAFEHALEALQHLPARPEIVAQVIDLHLGLRNALWPLGELTALFGSLQHAAARAEALGDPHRLGRVTAYLVVHFVAVGALDRALESGHRAVALATAVGDTPLTVAARHYLGLAYRSRGDYAQAIACFRMNVACLQDGPLLERVTMEGLVTVLSRRHLAACLAECGAFAEGAAPAAEGVQLAEAAAHLYSRVMAYWGVGYRALCQGDVAQAIPVLERAFELAQRTHIQVSVPSVAALLGQAYALAGRSADALALLEQAVAQADARQFLFDRARLAVWLGGAYLLAGRHEEAQIQAHRAFTFARAHQERGNEAYALRLLGDIATRRTPLEAASAAAHYQQGLALADALGMRPLQAHCHRGLGTLYAMVGQQGEAHSALWMARAMYQAMDMAFWLPETEATLAQVEGH